MSTKRPMECPTDHIASLEDQRLRRPVVDAIEQKLERAVWLAAECDLWLT